MALLAGCGPGQGAPAGGANSGLVLVRMLEGSSEIVRVRLRDSAVQPVTATPQRWEWWPYWSPVASRLVFQVGEPRGRSDLVLWSADAGEQPLTRTPRRDERWAAWSPRAAQLVYASRGGDPAAGLALYLLEEGKSHWLLRTGLDDYFFRPAFSPDATLLVMQRRSPNRGSSLWLATATQPIRALTDDPAWFDMKPCFSRDGARIFFSRRPAAGGPRDVMSIGAGGGDLRSHASLPAADDHSASPSPTRDEIVFVSNRDGAEALYLAALPDGPARRLSPPGLAAFAPHWSPDGELVAATATASDARAPVLSDPSSLAAARVIVLDREGQLLLDVPGLMPDWMPAWP